jgi:nucleoid-associated protein YgaU
VYPGLKRAAIEARDSPLVVKLDTAVPLALQASWRAAEAPPSSRNSLGGRDQDSATIHSYYMTHHLAVKGRDA